MTKNVEPKENRDSEPTLEFEKDNKTKPTEPENWNWTWLQKPQKTKN